MKYKSLAETCFCYLSMETAPGETPWLIFSAYKTRWEFRHRLPRGQVFTLPVLNSHLEPKISARGCSKNKWLSRAAGPSPPRRLDRGPSPLPLFHVNNEAPQMGNNTLCRKHQNCFDRSERAPLGSGEPSLVTT